MATKIYNVNDLQDMLNDLTGSYELANDIDASETENWNDGAGFIPIGAVGTGNEFRGQFNGKNYSITGLYINRPGTECVGLFGRTRNAAIANVKVLSARIVGYTWSAILMGLGISTTISNCFTTGRVSNGTAWWGAGFIGELSGGAITDCGTTAYVASGRSGGFVAMMSAGTIMRCFSAGTVSASHNYATGGFVGQSSYDTGQVIKDCYSRTNVLMTGWFEYGMGGFVGYHAYASNTIDNCYSTGCVFRNFTPSKGFRGVDGGGVVTDSFWDIETSGCSSSQGGVGKSTAQMKDINTFIEAGWDFQNVWAIDTTKVINDGYPYLRNMTPPPSTPTGFIWIEGTKFAYIDALQTKRTIEGTTVGITGKTPGHIWVQGEYLYYVDAAGVVRRTTSSTIGLAGKQPGQLSINLARGGTRLCYIDASGFERCLLGVAT